MDKKYLDYKLDSKRHNEFLELIKDFTFDGKKPVDNPTIVILGGQPGAGKGALINIAKSELQNAVVINGDEFRKFHPNSKEILIKHHKDYANYTDPDVREWTREIFDKAIKGKYNIIFEGTMRTCQICDTMKKLREKGYKINVKVLAVNEFESRLSIYQRYEEQITIFGNGRFTSRDAHDTAYSGMLNTLNIIEKENLCDNLQMYSRTNLIYESQNESHQRNAVEILIEERNKSWTQQKRENYIKRVNKVIESMEKRKEPNLIREINLLKEDVIKLYNDSRTII